MQRSRKALRLYSSVERLPNDNTSDLSELQISEWRRVNAELLKELGAALDQTTQKRMVNEVFGIRDQFYGEWKLSEADLHLKHRQLLECVENSDFIRASLLARELVALKARAQACQAAHHEVQELIHRSRVSQPALENPPLSVEKEASSEEVSEVKEEIRVARVIPLRKNVRTAS